MNYQYLVSKIALDKDNKKLGKIIRIENIPTRTIKKDKPHAMIAVEKIFQKDIIVPIELTYIVKVEGDYVWFNITKITFDEEVKQLRNAQKAREKSNGYDLTKRHQNIIVLSGYITPFKKKEKMNRNIF